MQFQEMPSGGRMRTALYSGMVPRRLYFLGIPFRGLYTTKAAEKGRKPFSAAFFFIQVRPSAGRRAHISLCNKRARALRKGKEVDRIRFHHLAPQARGVVDCLKKAVEVAFRRPVERLIKLQSALLYAIFPTFVKQRFLLGCSQRGDALFESLKPVADLVIHTIPSMFLSPFGAVFPPYDNINLARALYRNGRIAGMFPV